MKSLQVQVWSDIACPWCWVGKRHLETAIADSGLDVEVLWRAFQLDPSAPKQASDELDYVARLAKKYRATREQAQAMIDRMTQTGARSGLAFRFEHAKPSNTFDAHRLLHWAATQGKQSELKERLFVAYMRDGRSVSDAAVLQELAADVGLDPEAAKGVIASDAYASDVRGEQATAAELGITGVPFFIIDGRFAIHGAQPAAVLAEALAHGYDGSDAR